MRFWLEQFLKLLILLAAILSVGVACLVALLMIANGNATVADFWDWKIAVFGVALGASHCALIVAGCRSCWKFVDQLSNERN